MHSPSILSLSACLAILVVCEALPGQALPRSAVTGNLRLADGKPWVGAEVVCLSRLLADDPRTPADRVVAKSDERGAFRAELLKSRSYSIWARSRAAEKRWLVCEGEVLAVAGDRVRLRAQAKRVAEFSVQVEGLHHWAGLAPYRLALRGHGQNVVYFELPLEGRDNPRASLFPKPQIFVASCPPFAGKNVTAEVIGKGRVPLGKWNCNPSGGARLVVDEKRERLVDVRAQASEKGVARVAVHAKTIRGDAALLGRSDENGIAKLELPSAFIHEMFTVDDIDHALLGGQLMRDSYPQSKGKAAKADYHASLRHKTAARLRILLDGEPLPGQLWSATSLLHYSLGNRRLVTRSHRIVTRSDREGVVGVDLPRDGQRDGDLPSVLALDAATLERLGFAKLGVSPVIWNPAQPQFGRADFEVRSLRVVEVEVVHADGSPAKGAELRFLPRNTWEGAYWPERCDRRGRWRGLLPAARTASLGAIARRAAVGFFEVEVAKRGPAPADPKAAIEQAKADAREMLRLRLELRSGVAITGRVVDGKDRPLAGLTVALTSSGAFGPRREGPLRVSKARGLRVEALNLGRHANAPWRAGVFSDIEASSDARGRFVVHRPAFDGEWTLRVLRKHKIVHEEKLDPERVGDLVLRVTR